MDVGKAVMSLLYGMFAFLWVDQTPIYVCLSVGRPHPHLI